MTAPSRKQKGRVVTELARRIASLREGLGLGQRAFAEEISRRAGEPKGRVSHTQISEWERAGETPSTDKLIALAALARTAEEKAWFLAKAGVTEELVRETFSELAGERVRAANSLEVVEVPLCKGLSVSDEGELSISSGRSIPLPAEQFSSAPFVSCVRLDDATRMRLLFSPGDLVIVDRSPTKPRLDSLVLMFFERRPEYEGAPLSHEELSKLLKRSQRVSWEELEGEDRFLRNHFPEEFAENERNVKATWERINQEMKRSVMGVGWLRLVPAGGQWEGNFDSQLSRFSLELYPSPTGYTGYSIPLTDWLKGINPLDPDISAHVKRPNHIVGGVVGWIRQSGAREVR